MKFINFLLLIVLVALVIFAGLNWQAIMAPVPLALLFTNVQAPLGLILLGVTALLTLLFLGYVLYMQSSTLMTRRKLNKDLAAQRELADKAEASRITELRTFLEAELQKLTTQHNDIHQKLDSRLTEVEVGLKGSVEETGTTLSAYIGELEDRLEKK